MTTILKKIQTAWRSKEIAALISAISVFLVTSYGLDITPIIEAVEQSWAGIAALLAALGVTAIGKDGDA